MLCNQEQFEDRSPSVIGLTTLSVSIIIDSLFLKWKKYKANETMPYIF